MVFGRGRRPVGEQGTGVPGCAPFQRGQPCPVSEAWFPGSRHLRKHGKLDGRWLDVVIVERLIPSDLT